MQFFSTRDHNRVVSASQAIAQGLSDEGGLFVPQSFPQVDVKAICALDYPEMAAEIVGQYLTDYSQEFLQEAAKATYGAAFGGKAGYLAPVSDEVYSLELWHGPTCAFKDYALQLMPKLLVEAKKNLDRTEKTLILVATSGDTGKAALDGYHDIPGVEIAVFFPTGGTSEIQRLQMATQEGANVAVYAVRGNFDDAQTGVKKVFGDKAIAAELEQRGIRLSSANSINWGRLVPQIVYYFAAYAQLLKAGKIAFGDAVDFCVPTGNFGDILAGYYAKRMGLPVGKLVCASNENNVLTDFFTTGTYTAKREFFKTTSPSMDILVSSNLERLLYLLSEGDCGYVAGLMEQLNREGHYQVSPRLLERLQAEFDSHKQQHLRVLAEYDNFRKRSANEKNAVYNNAVSDTINAILPVADNIDRALAQENVSAEDMKKGVEMIANQFKASFEKLGIREVGQVGEPFDPALHNAVAHIESDELGENVISAVFQKGYMLGDKVVRHAMVQVAN